jgi:NAD-dependent deacetylase
MQLLIKKAARALANSSYAVALTGAGVSTESGIPDFRGPSGIWTRDPEAERRAYQTYSKFLADPAGYWRDVMNRPSPLFELLQKAKPNPSHYALAELESMGIIKCVITQNIDNLHRKAGSKNVLEFHGNAFKLRCISCNSRYNRDEYDLKRIVEEGRVPLCRKCGGALKSDTVFFTEPIPEDVYMQSVNEVLRCDLMLICGTSAVVYPFANLPRIAKQKTPAPTIIEVNIEPTPLTYEGISDFLIQGKTGEILPKIVEELKNIKNESMRAMT